MLGKEDFEKLLEYAPDCVIVINADGKIVFLNKQTEYTFLYSKQELLGKMVEVLIPDPYKESHVDYRKNFLKAPANSPMDHAGLYIFGRRKNGKEFPVEISLSPILTDNSDVLIIAAIRDIAPRTEMEEQLKQAQSLFQRIFESSIQGIVRLQEVLNQNQEIIDFRYTLVNKRAEELLGKSKQELTGRTVSELFPGFKERKTFKILCRVVDTHTTEMHEVETKIDGVNRWFKTNYLKVDDGIIITFDDITARKQSQIQLEELNQTLEKGVNERTKVLSSANNRLINMNEKLDKYAYLISHDIKAPINNILGLAEFIKADYKGKSFDEEGAQMIDMMIAKCEDVKMIVDNLLQTAKDEIKNKENVDLNHLITSVIDTLNPPGHFHFLIQHNLPMVKFPKASIMQIFQNLLSNAIKYMDKESPLITITCKEMQNAYLICVSDNGSGMPSEKLDRIFDMFEIAHEERKQTESHGIGLSIVKQLVEENGGLISVESELRVGSKFHFTLPK